MSREKVTASGLGPATLDCIRVIAGEAHMSVDEFIEQAMSCRLDVKYQQRFFELQRKRISSHSVEEGLAILNRAGVGNPPDPGDELPEDLQYLLHERRS